MAGGGDVDNLPSEAYGATSMDMPTGEPLHLGLVAGHPTKVRESCVSLYLYLRPQACGPMAVHGGPWVWVKFSGLGTESETWTIW